MTDTNGSAQNADNALENGDKNESPPQQILETDKEREERQFSLWIIYFTMFLISLGFSIVLTGIWPYLDKVRSTSSTCYYFFIIHYFLARSNGWKGIHGLYSCSKSTRSDDLLTNFRMVVK